MEDISEYLHLYLGCECKGEGLMIYKLSGITKDCKGNNRYFLLDSMVNTCVDVEFKPILRRIDSMTKEEKIIYKVRPIPSNMTLYQWAGAQSFNLIKAGFWLFGDEAFEKGLIIEKK